MENAVLCRMRLSEVTVMLLAINTGQVICILFIASHNPAMYTGVISDIYFEC
jgi:hypothetical protein